MNKENSIHYLERLFEEVQNVFRCKILTAANCDLLSKEIQVKTSHYISSQTIRRLFGLVKTNTFPSLFTLNALSLYCGYQDWGEFCLEKIEIEKSYVQNESISKWIVDFYRAPLPNLWPSPDYYIACKNVAQRIVMNESLFETLPSQLATLPSGQILFFECFPYIDGLCRGYQRHLQVYLQNKANDWESAIFANCLLFLGSFLARNNERTKQYFAIINSLACPLPGQVHCIPTARYLGTQIVYNQLIGNQAETTFWIGKAINDYAPVYKNQELGFCNFFFILGEYLFLGGYYTECLDILKYQDRYRWNDYFINNPFDLGYYEVMKLMLAVSNIKIGNTSVGKQLMKEVSTGNFTFTKRELYTLCFLREQLRQCGANVNVKRRKIENQIQELVKRTGFIHFAVVVR
jgi:hypothetical protein